MNVFFLALVVAVSTSDPCEDGIASQIPAMDMFILLDSSKSLHPEDWEGEKLLATQLVNQFEEQVQDLQVGFLTYTGHWERKNEMKEPVLRNITNLGTSTEDLIDAIHSLPDAKSYLQLGTNFHDPMRECKSQLEKFGRQDSFKLCVLMTDGYDMSGTYPPEPCARGCRDPVETAEEVKQWNDTKILSIFAGYGSQSKVLKGREETLAISSCLNDEPCPYYIDLSLEGRGFGDMSAQALSNMTSSIINENTIELDCVEAEVAINGSEQTEQDSNPSNITNQDPAKPDTPSSESEQNKDTWEIKKENLILIIVVTAVTFSLCTCMAVYLCMHESNSVPPGITLEDSKNEAFL